MIESDLTTGIKNYVAFLIFRLFSKIENVTITINLMKKIYRNSQIFLLLYCLFALLISCAHNQYSQQPITITIAHLNDTHSHLEADRDAEWMKFEGVDTKVYLGGFTRLKTAMDKMRNESNNFVLLHAGDAVQGTLYFTLFNGDADIEFLNLLGIDAMTFGNHEFDKGPDMTSKIVNSARLPFISANIDFAGIPAIAEKVKPYLIKNFDGEKVAIIGITTENTAQISNPGPNIKFNDVTKSLLKTVNELTAMGINKIIVVSHIGYEEDKKLAQSVSGIDVIVGGHSHTLLGDKTAFGSLGINTQAEYPTVIKSPEGIDVLIVQAWRWGGTIGLLTVDFDEQGHIKGYSGQPTLIMGETFIQDKKVVPYGSDTYKRILQVISDSKVAGVYEEDPFAKKMLQPYKEQLDILMKTIIAEAKDDLISGLNSGLGPIITDGMIWKTGAQIALLNRGGARSDIYAGGISVGKVMEVLPFNNTLFSIELSGAEIKNVLEDGVDFQIVHNASNPLFPYVSGMTYVVNKSSLKGSRIKEIKVKQPEGTYVDIDMQKTYTLATLSYIAGQGGDGYTFLKDFKGFKYDTGLIDSDVFIEYLKYLKTVSSPTEDRITIKSSPGARLILEETSVKKISRQTFEHQRKAA